MPEEAVVDSPAVETTENYVSDVLLNPDGPQPFGAEPIDRSTTRPATEQPQPETEEVQDEQPEHPAQAAQPVPTQPLTVEQLVQKYAKELGLNPNDPAQRRALKVLADKELFVQKLQGENRTLRQQPEDQLTPFERSLMKPEDQPVKPVAQPTPDQPRTDQAPPLMLGDYGDRWAKETNQTAAYLKDLGEAWTAGDLERVAAIENAAFSRRFLATGLPLVDRYTRELVGQVLNERLGPLLESVKPLTDQRDQLYSRDTALAELRKTPAFADIDKMHDPEEAGTITIEGEVLPRTPFNRIALANPDILAIRVEHKDPQIAKTLTNIAIYRAIHGIWKREQNQGLDPAKAAQLVEAGKTVARRNAADKARTGVNAGPGGRSPQGDQSYVESLVNSRREGEGVPFSSLIS
jgi:hypothetical protein